MKYINEQNNFFFFTLSLIVLLLASALTEYVPDGVTNLFLKLVILGTVVIAYLSLDFGRAWRQFVMLVVAVLVLANAAEEILKNPMVGVIHMVGTLSFFVAAAYFAAKRVLLSGKVNANTIVGSLAIYLLLGLIWAMLYMLILQFIPEPFTGLEYQVEWGNNFDTAVYFSYVTLTTLGYGDISPTSPLSHVVVYLEAITGTFYMAIVVASLIGARATPRMQ